MTTDLPLPDHPRDHPRDHHDRRRREVNHECAGGCAMCRDETSTTLPRVIPLSEVRVGDTVRVVDEGVVSRIDSDLDLLTVGDRNVYIGGPNLASRPVTVELVDRPTPPLPTELGSVIVDATIRGVEGCTAIHLGEGCWVTASPFVGYHYPEHITAWTPARIVADGEQVTL